LTPFRDTDNEKGRTTDVSEIKITRIDMSAANKVPPRGEEFFKVISRFEFALKDIGFARMGRDEVPEIKWDDFANGLGREFYNKIKIEGVAPTLLSEPPRLQLIRANRLEWQDARPPSNVQELFGAVRRVRNNLFHGGKSGEADNQRSEKLIAEAIAVLQEALQASDNIRRSFEG
jgi:hypothetical protein